MLKTLLKVGHYLNLYGDKMKRKSELYDKRPTLGPNGESWDMFIVRKIRERRIEDKNIKRYTKMSKVDVTIYYDSGEKRIIKGLEKKDIEKTIDLYSKPVNGKVDKVELEDQKTNLPYMDLDGYFALMEANTAL